MYRKKRFLHINLGWCLFLRSHESGERANTFKCSLLYTEDRRQQKTHTFFSVDSRAYTRSLSSSTAAAEQPQQMGRWWPNLRFLLFSLYSLFRNSIRNSTEFVFYFCVAAATRHQHHRTNVIAKIAIAVVHRSQIGTQSPQATTQ